MMNQKEPRRKRRMRREWDKWNAVIPTADEEFSFVSV
jgi:hypothetical protein